MYSQILKCVVIWLFLLEKWWLEYVSLNFACIIAAAPGVKMVPTAAGVVISQNAQVYQPHIIAQAAVQVIDFCQFWAYPTVLKMQ